MKNFSINVFFLLITLLVAQAQKSGIASYQVVPKDLSNILNRNDKETNTVVRQTLSVATDFNFILYFDTGASLYYKEEQLNTDANSNLSHKLASALTDKGTYYQNKEQSLSIRAFHGLGKDYLIQNNLFLEFVITNERKKINEFECIKAILKCIDCKEKSEVVWFAPSIPVPFGPEGYGGLPGLILEVEKRTFSLQLSKLQFKGIPKNKIKKPTKGEEITKEAYLELSKKVRQSFSG